MSTSLRFEVLIEQYHDEIYGYLWRLIQASRADAAIEVQDLTQEVFIRAYNAFTRLRPDSNHRAWLYKIATNCAYTALRRGLRQDSRSTPLPEEDHDQPADPGHSPEAQAALNETMADLHSAIAELPEKQQAAVVMRHVQGLSYSEIAGALACSEDSARANVYQGIKRLRQVMGAAL